MTAHDDHLATAALYTGGGGQDELLYVSRPDPLRGPTRYVWRSGVKLGLTESSTWLARLMTAEGLVPTRLGRRGSPPLTRREGGNVPRI